MDNKNKEIKRKRFENVAAKRVKKVLNDIDVLSKCSNKSNYDYSEKDIEKMMRAIREKVRFLEASFQQKGENNKNEFKF